MSQDSTPHISQVAFQNVYAKVIRVGNITQTVNYIQKPQALSTDIKSWLPPIPREWQTRPEEQLIKIDFADPHIRLVGLHALGGYGKSALASQVYNQAQGFGQKLWANFQEPVSFGTFGRWLLQELLGKEYYVQVRELYERDSDAELVTKALNELTQRRCLLVLDNLETLFQDEELWQPYGKFLAEWLGQGGGGLVLLTSQFRLDLPTAAWKWYGLKGLEVTQGVALLKAEEIEGKDEDLKAFVAATDGHPLLLILSVNLLKKRHQNDLAAPAIYRLEQDDVSLLRQVTEMHRGDPEASVGKVLDASFQRLYPESLRVLLWRLSVLRGHFELAAAQAMVIEGVKLEDLRGLARWGFLQERLTQEGWEFEFLPLVQRYLRTSATESAEDNVGHTKAYSYFYSLTPTEFCTSDKLDAARPYFEMMYHACELKAFRVACDSTQQIFYFLERWGSYKELAEVYERLIREWDNNAPDFVDMRGNLALIYSRLGNHQRSIELYENSLAQPLDPENRARRFSGLGDAYLCIGNYQKAIECYQERLRYGQESNQLFDQASGFSSLAGAYAVANQIESALECSQQALELAYQLKNPGLEATALKGLGDAYSLMKQPVKAIDCYQKALNIDRDLGDRVRQKNVLCCLIDLYESLGEYGLVINCCKQLLVILKEMGDRQGEANSFATLGNTLVQVGRTDEALSYFKEARAIYEELELDQMVEQCRIVIANYENRTIASERKKHIDSSQKTPVWIWSIVGFVIVLLIWWLKR